MAPPVVKLTVDQKALVALGRALKAEADGREMRRDLIRELRKPLAPAISEIKAGVMAMPSAGLPVAEGPPLRASVARRIRPEVKLSGRAPGVRIKARKTENVRGFRNAPKRLNSPKGWRHPVWGRDVWVQQLGQPRFFDEPIERRRGEFRGAVVRAMHDTARRLSIRVKV